MSRRRRATKRVPAPDPKYNSALVGGLINIVMRNGKKSLAQKIVYSALERLSEKLGKGNPHELVIGGLG